MNKVILAVALVIMGLMTGACERNDYQHPLHRNQ